MDKPLISVIIPAYRCVATLAGAIDSALAQQVALEVLVIDDCSPEDLSSVTDRYRQEPRVICLKNEKNLGAAETRNRGVAMARGEWVAFLDADDLWVPGKLQKQLAALEGSGAVLCATAREQLAPDGTSLNRVIPVKETVTYQDLLRHNCIACSSVLLRTDVAREFPMHHADSHEDYILWLEILRKYRRAVGINEPLLRYRTSTTGKSGSKLHSAKMTFQVYRYMGFGPVKSAVCFCSYAIHGVYKHFLGGKMK